MTLEFVVITGGRFGSVRRTLIITEALRAPKCRRPFGRRYFRIFTWVPLSSLSPKLFSHARYTCYRCGNAVKIARWSDIKLLFPRSKLHGLCLSSVDFCGLIDGQCYLNENDVGILLHLVF